MEPLKKQQPCVCCEMSGYVTLVPIAEMKIRVRMTAVTRVSGESADH